MPKARKNRKYEYLSAEGILFSMYAHDDNDVRRVIKQLDAPPKYIVEVTDNRREVKI